MTATKPAITRTLLCVAGLSIALSTALHAQSIIGTWQGTLPAGENPRIVLKIAKADDDSLRGTLGFIDRGAGSVPLYSVTFAAPDFGIDLGAISYRGKLSADRTSISGTWTWGGHSDPLTFVLATPDTLWTFSGAAPLPPMSATADPAFEVATIKPSRPGANSWGYSIRTRQFEARQNTVTDLIKFAYQVRDRQIDGGPSWMSEDKFDIVAEPDAAGQPSVDQDRLMLQKLLAERFGLSLHMVERDFPVYALTLDKGPQKLTRSQPNAGSHSGIYTKELADDEQLAQFAYFTMREFADLLMNFLKDRQILDETGLTGQFDFALTIPTTAVHGGQSPDDVNAAFLGALQPLGFKLVPKKEPLQVIVIDHLDKPSPN